METVKETEAGAPSAQRIIKRYSNRKLYDTQGSRYVTLQQIGEMVRAGEEVQIIDNKTKEDKTEVTLALILSEDLKNRPRSVPLGTLRTLIQERGGKLLSQLRGGAIGRLIPNAEAEGDALTETEMGWEQANPTEPVTPKPAPVEAKPAATEADLLASKGRLAGLIETWEGWQTAVDERIRTMLPVVGQLKELQSEVKRLTDRLEAAERELQELKSKDK